MPGSWVYIAHDWYINGIWPYICHIHVIWQVYDRYTIDKSMSYDHVSRMTAIYDSHMTGPNSNVTGTEKAQKVWSGYIAVTRLTWSYDILLLIVYLSYTCHITFIWHIYGHIPLIYQSCAMYTHEPGIW